MYFLAEYVFSRSDVDYRYYVHRMPYVDYSSKQMSPLMSKEEVLAEVGLHEAEWRLQRKRHAVRVEFESLGKEKRVHGHTSLCLSSYIFELFVTNGSTSCGHTNGSK